MFTTIIYIDKSSRRVVRSSPDTILFPSSLKNYEIKFVSVKEENYIRLQSQPYNFIFSEIFGLVYNVAQNFNKEQFDLINLKLNTVENLWRIGNSFIKNSVNQYFYNKEIYDIVKYEKEFNLSNVDDSLTNFIRQIDTDLDTDSYHDLTSLYLEYVYQKRKDIVKNLLISQEKIMDSKTPILTLEEELKTIYIKY